ncbi:MAG: hypothetical protein LBT79_00315 [Elusimicrobiota bacterium]|jgi:hypothetical protein|nr:hypothetical protein [Elusimicrobiota bacterium]
MKKFLQSIRKFWWNGMYETAGKIYKTSHRNDEHIMAENRLKNPVFLESFGYKVYSQNDEDGIIDEIFNRIGVTNKKFVEFGVENGLESNGHFLLHKGFKGLWIECNNRMIKQLNLLFDKPIKEKQLTIVEGFINKDNINQLIGGGGVYSREIDLLSIDIDGNDYWIWEAIECISPRVVVIEYNAKFPPTHEWVMKYNERHLWDGSDEQGASLKSLEILGRKLNYQLVATNMNGSNAFFVKKDITKNLFAKPDTAENLYNPIRHFHYISGHNSTKYIG